LHELVTQLISDPFDRSRPLWEFVVIDGLEGGRAAMLQKLHHTLMDGKGGLRISEQFVDFERDAADLPPIELPDAVPDEATLVSSLSDPATHLARRGLGAAHRTMGDVGAALRSPSAAVRLGRDATGVATSAARQIRLDDGQASPLWHARSLRRWFGT